MLAILHLDQLWIWEGNSHRLRWSCCVNYSLMQACRLHSAGLPISLPYTRIISQFPFLLQTPTFWISCSKNIAIYRAQSNVVKSLFSYVQNLFGYTHQNSVKHLSLCSYVQLFADKQSNISCICRKCIQNVSQMNTECIQWNTEWSLNSGLHSVETDLLGVLGVHSTA